MEGADSIDVLGYGILSAHAHPPTRFKLRSFSWSRQGGARRAVFRTVTREAGRSNLKDSGQRHSMTLILSLEPDLDVSFSRHGCQLLAELPRVSDGLARFSSPA